MSAQDEGALGAYEHGSGTVFAFPNRGGREARPWRWRVWTVEVRLIASHIRGVIGGLHPPIPMRGRFMSVTRWEPQFKLRLPSMDIAHFALYKAAPQKPYPLP